MSRAAAEREQAEELMEWAGEHCPYLAAEVAEDPSDAQRVAVGMEAIRAAKYEADWRRHRDAAARQDSGAGYEPEPF